MARSYRAAEGLVRLRSLLGLMAQATVPTVEVSIDNLSASKLRWLRLGGRDFEKPTGDLLRAMGAAYAQGLMRLARGRSRDATLPWLLAAEVYRDALASRLATSGGDLRSQMTPLSPETIARKGHARIGVDTGALLRDVATATIRVKARP